VSKSQSRGEDGQERRQRAVDVLESVVATGQHPKRTERIEYFQASCWDHQDCHVADEKKKALKISAGVLRGKDKCQVQLKERERDYWMGKKKACSEAMGFQGQVTAGQKRQNESRTY